jgi:hypothetical protein
VKSNGDSRTIPWRAFCYRGLRGKCARPTNGKRAALLETITWQVQSLRSHQSFCTLDLLYSVEKARLAFLMT